MREKSYDDDSCLLYFPFKLVEDDELVSNGIDEALERWQFKGFSKVKMCSAVKDGPMLILRLGFRK